MIAIRYEDCINCLNCYHVCPLGAIDLDAGTVAFTREENCIACGHCGAVCPKDAIDAHYIKSLPGKDLAGMILPPFESLENTMLSRRSIRAYENKRVETEKIERLLRVAAHAPTGRNRQDCKFVVTGPAGNDALEKMARDYFLQNAEDGIGRIIRESDYSVLLKAPAMIGVYGPKDNGIWSCALAAQNLVIAAHGMGLGTCYNGIFLGAYYQDEKIRNYIALDQAYRMQMFIMLGYPKASISYRHMIERKEPDVRWLD